MPASEQVVQPAAGDQAQLSTEVIEIRIGELRQLFNAIDPSPFRQRDLDPNAEEFIVGWARDARGGARLGLKVYLSSPSPADQVVVVREAIREFFSHRANSTKQRLRHLFRIGRTSFLIGFLVLAVSIGIGSLIASAYPGRPAGEFLRESLLIGGWVAMWRPLEIFLYDWWPIRAEADLFDRLSAMPVQIVRTQGANSDPCVGPGTLS